MRAVHRYARALIAIAVTLVLVGCEGLRIADTQSLLIPRLMRPEVLGLAAGFGTTFAAVPDLLSMLRRRSTQGLNPKMSAIMGTFQVLWIWYGLVIASRPVIIWNVIGVITNFVTVGAYFYFARAARKHNADSI
jgi:uncharacterized protein with PQ loop repeat